MVWSTIPASANVQSDEEDSDDNKDVDSAGSPSGDLIASIVQESSTECSTDFEADIKTLQAGKMIDSEMELKLTGLHKLFLSLKMLIVSLFQCTKYQVPMVISLFHHLWKLH